MRAWRSGHRQHFQAIAAPLLESERAALASGRLLRLGSKEGQTRQIGQLSRAPGAAWCRRTIVGLAARGVEDRNDVEARRMIVDKTVARASRSGSGIADKASWSEGQIELRAAKLAEVANRIWTAF